MTCIILHRPYFPSGLNLKTPKTSSVRTWPWCEYIESRRVQLVRELVVFTIWPHFHKFYNNYSKKARVFQNNLNGLALWNSRQKRDLLKLRPGIARSTRPTAAWPSGRSRGRPSLRRWKCPPLGQRCRRKDLRVHPRRQCDGGLWCEGSRKSV